MHNVHAVVNGRDVVVAIIGGTLLGLALTRPRLAWLERLDDGSRRYGEIVMTVGAFVIGGYAYGSLYLVLHRQLGGEIDKLLRGAGVIFGVYAAFVHFEPFSDGEGWREVGSAMLLYVAVGVAAVLGGVVCVEYTLDGSVGSWSSFMKMIVPVVGSYGIYRFARRLRGAVGEVYPQ